MARAQYHKWVSPVAALLAVLLLFAPALARESTPVKTPRSTASLVSDVDAVAAGQPFRLGLHLQLAPGWHTYGPESGDAGVPAELTLDLPNGAKAGAIDWPRAQRFVEGPVTTYGYAGDVLLPLTITPAGTPAGATAIVAHANWLVCKDICVPEEGAFRLDLPAGQPGPSAQAALFSTPGGADAVTREAAPSLGRVLGLAFLGGLILNLMPCVFPVLAMKAVSLANGVARREVRAQAVLYSAGVVVAFAALGGLLLAARGLGAAAGWGFQFQSPVFVAVMAWLLFVIGLNLSGVFEVGHGLAAAGHGLASRGGHAGSFFTGLLAVAVATPCTAPFMGVAVAAALAGPAMVALLVFVVMGVGLATPSLLLAAIPGAARIAPRPGRWMLVLKQALAFPMYAAVAWLVWVVSQEAGPGGMLTVLVGLVLLGFAAWAYGAAHGRIGAGARVGRIAALAACIVAAVMLTGIAAAPPGGGPVRAEMGVEPFSAARLAALRAAGRPVFVNMTAAWCVTCLVNERVAIGTSAVRAAFDAGRVAYLKGDWTRQDPEISAFLRAHGRDGVPLYVYFPAGNAPATVLPQILTQSTLLDEIAGGRS